MSGPDTPELAGGATLEYVLALKRETDLALYLLTDIVQKAIPYGTQDGEFVASYLLQTGPIHRAIAFLQQRGIPTSAAEPS